MTKKRIVVTGLGIVSCFGNDVDLFYQSLLAGKSGAAPIAGFACDDYPTRIAAEIKGFDPGDYIEKKQARRIDKCMAYCIVAGKKALEQANLGADALEHLNKNRCGIVIGSDLHKNLFEHGQIEVQGRDSFSNIQAHLDEQLKK